MVIKWTPKSSQTASGHGINVGRGVSGDLNIDNTVNHTVVNLHEAISSNRGFSLDEGALEFLLRREVKNAIQPYANALGEARAQVASLRDSVAARDQILDQVTDENEHLQQRLGRQNTSRRILAIAGALLVASGLAVGVFVRGMFVDSRVEASPTVGVQASPSMTPVESASRPQDAEMLMRKYFELGDQHQAEAMWALTSQGFKDNSQGYIDYAYWWNGGFVDIDALISPGRSPQVDPSDSTVTWVQVAWRHKSKVGTDLRTVDFDVKWYPVILASGRYQLDTGSKWGAPRHCAPREVASCTQSDSFSP